ncbi:hypothetical protein ARSEF1564_001475 [Beauveria bassiana]
MGKNITPAKVLLLAAYLAAQGDIDKLASLALHNAHVLHIEILLRVILTYLPETAEPCAYTEFLRDLSDGQLRAPAHFELDTSSVDMLNDEIAVKKAKKLHLLPLYRENAENGKNDDLVRDFIFQRAYRINAEVGALSQLVDLLRPFLDKDPSLNHWAASTVLPFVRRSCEYHTSDSPEYSLSEFENLPDRTAARFLLPDSTEEDGEAIGRDLRGLIAPWLHNERRWKHENAPESGIGLSCPGWEQVQDIILSWATKSWTSVSSAICHWEGPRDIYFGEHLTMSLSEDKVQYLLKTYATTAVACVYSVTESSEDALRSSYRVSCITRKRLDDAESFFTLEEIMSDFTLLPAFKTILGGDPSMSAFMRHDLLKTSNPLTSATPEALKLITALTIRLSSHSCGPLGMVSRDHIETEILKTLLSKSKYSLSKELYEDAKEPPLARDVLQDAVYHSALNAFDNASNPNRTRGGLKKCDEIIHTFPSMLGKSSTTVKRVEALLRASHALSDYRLVLKQGEPFSPVVLRVHSDPIIIIEKVLNQNPKAYTRLQEFLEMGANMVYAGLTSPGSSIRPAVTSLDVERGLFVAEKRIVAMCIEAALNEEDFETAYSYVVSRVGKATTTRLDQAITMPDAWSWTAALKAGQYIRTERSQQPTHLGTASGNLEIRHLEQRIECLATAIRAAPPAELQQILKSFRRCEEQLDSAIRQEAANEAAWDAAGDFSALPGNFDPAVQRPGQSTRNMTASTAARQGEEAPMSLFDLSRATARIAQRNFTALPSLQGTSSAAESHAPLQEQTESRTRKRDQLREAATGTLVSGVGWLLGAPVNGGSAGNE